MTAVKLSTLCKPDYTRTVPSTLLLCSEVLEHSACLVRSFIIQNEVKWLQSPPLTRSDTSCIDQLWYFCPQSTLSACQVEGTKMSLWNYGVTTITGSWRLLLLHVWSSKLVYRFLMHRRGCSKQNSKQSLVFGWSSWETHLRLWVASQIPHFVSVQEGLVW